MPLVPVVPRPAATVLLLRDDPHPPEGRPPLQVFLQRRVAGMAFAGGMTVFPGGGVDASDRPDASRWSGPDPTWWGQRLGCDPESAGALVAAAVRETFEECGVLLAGRGRPDLAIRPDLAVRPDDRAGLVARRRTLGQVLADAGLVLRADLLAPWSRWITPEPLPKRYDTAFFVALVPPGQEADAHTTEAVEAAWWHPGAALEAGRRGDVKLMAPTVRTLQEIGEHADRAAVLAAAQSREIRPVRPWVTDGGAVVLPGDLGRSPV